MCTGTHTIIYGPRGLVRFFELPERTGVDKHQTAQVL